jgi:hypothetical protein
MPNHLRLRQFEGNAGIAGRWGLVHAILLAQPALFKLTRRQGIAFAR